MAYVHHCIGLGDTEEFVVSKALNALTCLAELGLLQKPALQELVCEIVPYLCHPLAGQIVGALPCAVQDKDQITMKQMRSLFLFSASCIPKE
ncbi:probable serine/threonine-protein kinase vps15 [Acropora millepora]|uniref:probable serine/threonine-protein kinase vps15 n=1 Tax=Acropora millepora TaxID=45264 RepID=UPI001CF4AD7C|nr:probable serine/threonine-protein kinase vps15 [Acropora millepora]